jgi:hypothetical protein
MNSQTSRRDLLLVGSQAALTSTAFAGMWSAPVLADERPNEADAGKLWPGYPRVDQKLVNEVVGASHFNETRVRELVKGYPELVNARSTVSTCSVPIRWAASVIIRISGT